MWYRSAQLYDTSGKNLLAPDTRTNFDVANSVALKGLPNEFASQARTHWSSVTWNPQYGLQFWTSDGKLIGAQQPGSNIFETLRAFEPSRFKSNVTDKIILDLYKRGKAAEQALFLARSQNPSLPTQQIVQIVASYMKEYNVIPQFNEQGNLQNLPEYYPQQTPQEDAVIRQNMEREYLAALKKGNEKSFQFTDAKSSESRAQYRARYTNEYGKAYALYESNGRKMPFAQWKKQFDEDFVRGQYGTSTGTITPEMNQVQSQNQVAGTYQMKQDARGNVSILQSDGRVYSYIPANQVQYQSAYIQKMTGKTPVVAAKPAT